MKEEGGMVRGGDNENSRAPTKNRNETENLTMLFDRRIRGQVSPAHAGVS